MATDRNAIAHATRALPAISALAELWQQLPDESVPEYQAFLEWLDQGTSRGAPAQRWQLVATTNDWAQRALAYERASDLAAGDAAGSTPEHQIVSNLTRMVQIEVKKLLDQSAKTQQPVVPLKELIAAMGLIQQFADAGLAAKSQKTDLSKYTTEEIKEIVRVQNMMRQRAR